MTALPAAERTPAMKKAARICRDQLLAQDVSRYVSPHASEFYEHLAALPAGSAPRSWSWKPERRAAIAPIKVEFVKSRGITGAEDEIAIVRDQIDGTTEADAQNG